MSPDRPTCPADVELDESAVSRAELHIEREKIQIERERLALERERLAAERERWKNDAEMKSHAEGRGITFSTLFFVGIICVLAGVIAGLFSAGPRASRTSAARLEALMSKTATNAAGRASGSIVLRPVETGGGGRAYLLLLD